MAPSGRVSPSSSNCVQRLKTASGAPLQIRRCASPRRFDDHDRHHLAREVEGDFVDLGVVGDREMLVHLLVLEDRAVQHVFQAGLKVAVEIGQLQHARRLACRTTSQCFSRMTRSIVSVPVLSVQRTSIAPRFWIELSRLTITFLRDMAMAPLERQTADDHRQHFRRQADRDRQREEEGFAPVVLAEAVDEEHQRHHDGHELDHEPGETGYALVEAGRRRLLRDGAGHAAEVRVQAGSTTTAVAEPLSTLVPRKQMFLSSSGDLPADGLGERQISPPGMIHR